MKNKHLKKINNTSKAIIKAQAEKNKGKFIFEKSG